jgi:tellurite resistance protein TerC
MVWIQTQDGADLHAVDAQSSLPTDPGLGYGATMLAWGLNSDLGMTLTGFWAKADIRSPAIAFGDRGEKAVELFKEKGEWAALIELIIIMIIIDFTLFSRCKGFLAHVFLIVFYLCFAAGYAVWYSQDHGKVLAEEWILGFFLELVLSFDNLFVFHLIIKICKVPTNQIHKALFVGIGFALILRFVLFLFVGPTAQSMTLVHTFLAFFLIYSGIMTLQDDDDDEEVPDFALLRVLRTVVGDRQLNRYDPDGAVFVWDDDGKLRVTMLLPVLVSLELADILFAMDSLSAKIAQMSSMQAAFSSSAFAIFTLRALYFVLCDMAEYFEHLKYGICTILIFLGVEMLIENWYQISSAQMVLFIIAIFLVSIVSSIVSSKCKRPTDNEKGEDSPKATKSAKSSDLAVDKVI